MNRSLGSCCRFAFNCGMPKRHQSSEVQKPINETLKPTVDSSQTPKAGVKMSLAKKRMFVCAGLYKSVKDVPDAVSVSTMARNMDKVRVRASILIMILCATGAISSIYLGKAVIFDLEESRDKKW